MDGQAKFFRQSHHNTAAGTAIKFCDNHARQPCCFFERRDLREGVLAHRAIQHNDAIMGGGFIFLGDHPANFGQFIHQFFFGLQTASGIDNQDIGLFGDRLFIGLIRNRGGIAAGLP